MAGIRATTIQKIIAMLRANSVIAQYCGTNVYGAHLSTIQDYNAPCISICILSSPGREIDGAFFDCLELQIEPWIDSSGKNNFTWDDVIAIHEAIVDTLHRSGGWDNSLGIKILEITNILEGAQMVDDDGMMHYPSHWRVKATQ